MVRRKCSEWIFGRSKPPAAVLKFIYLKGKRVKGKSKAQRQKAQSDCSFKIAECRIKR
jgi:hypothetical protein